MHNHKKTQKRLPKVGSYNITNYTYSQAKKYGVTVKPSTNKTKKIDIFKKSKKIASVGALGMGDYPTFMNIEGMKSAREHRRKYKIRHQKYRTIRGSRSWYADKLLW